MKYNNDFSHDLEVGQIGEHALGQILEGTDIEVKTDLRAHRTGNVFVEYQSRGKPSGIAKTNAQWWAFIISDTQIILIETEKLKEVCRELYNLSSVVGGDNDTSSGVLVPISRLVLT